MDKNLARARGESMRVKTGLGIGETELINRLDKYSRRNKSG